MKLPPGRAIVEVKRFGRDVYTFRWIGMRDWLVGMSDEMTAEHMPFPWKLEKVESLPNGIGLYRRVD